VVTSIVHSHYSTSKGVTVQIGAAMQNKQRYIEIASALHQLSVFAQPWWLDASCPSWDVAIETEDSTIIAAWPYPIERKYGGTLLRVPATTPYMGPQFFLSEKLKHYKYDNLTHDLVCALLKQFPYSNYVNLSLPPGIKHAGALKSSGYQSSVRQTFLIDLNLGEDELLANMRQNLSRNIVRGTNDLSISEDPAALKLLYDYHIATLTAKRKRVNYKVSQLQNLLDGCIEHDAGRLYTAKLNGEVQAVLWHVWDRHCGYNLMAAKNPSVNNYTALSALIWHAMRQTKAKGIGCFDLEGSMDPGVEQFYRNFGGTRELYLIIQKSRGLPWNWLQWKSW
jgi:hypothetical protein